MAARNKPAGIRSLVYGMGKGKGGIEGFERVSASRIPGTWPSELEIKGRVDYTASPLLPSPVDKVVS